MPKAEWGEGPWQHEPDDFEWTTECGYPALMARNRHGSWCGYVAVTAGHPLFEQGPFEAGLSVHGGPNISGRMRDKSPELWWFGFDCNHVFDESPAMRALIHQVLGRELPTGGKYWTVDMVRAECESLAAQLHARATSAANPPRGDVED